MAWSCDQCGRNVTSNPLLCDLCGAGAPGSDPARVAMAGQRDLHMEAHLRGLSMFYRGFSVLMLLFFLLMAAGLRSFGGSMGEWRGLFDRMMLMMLGGTGIVCAGWYALNHFVARYSNVARIITGVLIALSGALVTISTLMVLFAPRPEFPSTFYHDRYYAYDAGPSIGWLLLRFLLIIGWTAGVLWVLFSRRSAQICSERYRELVAKTAEVKPAWYRSPFFVIPTGLVVVGLLFLLLIAVQIRSSMY